ncbi:Imidazole glycerol phosphate synthase subunit HisH 1 [Bhargavaea cecembensis DSE10]|uniref:Imidazole glycerol phosphate synthase subunit HisH n=1 Tax=Bhargavaea cecembensis DSE10 TaxID=1235279 RepID=M7NKQ5_9BACL|nr:imidazole glycerol phosphate synthase subunit HisH [Bhargavaea cecembensis]EMR07721.1 Imidazole glycerol phosphate synthase subunit HisH 1 [Bhargavaea cecembensis DSE10]
MNTRETATAGLTDGRRIAIVDYGLGNVANVRRALEFLGHRVELTKDPDVLRRADVLILPGVGHFADAMKRLEADGLIPLLAELKEEKPLVGICLGMQLLFGHSEEGDADGLGFIPGAITRIETRLPVPHLGWNALVSERPELDGKDMYFIHTYKAAPGPDTVATADYGGETVTAIVQRGQLIGIQFHPEKSGDAGLVLLQQAVTGGFREKEEASE